MRIEGIGRSARAMLTLTLALALAACVPPEPDNDVIPRFDEDTLAGQIQQRGVIRVGISSDPSPPFIDYGGGLAPYGFHVDLAHDLAEALGVAPEFVPLEPTQIVTAADAGEVDVAFPLPLQPITEARVRLHVYTNPYYVGHQRLLVPKGSPIDGPDDLDGRKVCSASTAETGLSVSEFAPGAEPFAGDCSALLAEGTVDAVTGSDATLMRLWSEQEKCSPPACTPTRYRIAGPDITTEGYGAVVPLGGRQWAGFAGSVWGEAEDEGRWREWWDEWFAPYLRSEADEIEPPVMDVEQAAALHPCPIVMPATCKLDQG